MFKKLHINIPFLEALEQMSSYEKLRKKILSHKKGFKHDETMIRNKKCNTILQNKLPPKLKNLESFTILCVIGDVWFSKALCDLGVNINLMPLSIFKKLRVGELKPTIISLQLEDRSIKHSRDIIEDMLVKVHNFIFSVDFIVPDMSYAFLGDIS